MRRKCWRALAIALAWGAAHQAGAVSITVVNPSFENPLLAGPGAFTNAPIPGWAGNAFRGVFQPNIGSDVLSVPDGIQVAYIFGAGSISQDLGIAVQSGVNYQLDMWVGPQQGFAGNYVVKLLASDLTVIASAAGALASTGPFIPISISGAGVGTGDLVVELDSTGGQPMFDDVRVQSSAQDAAAAPEPAAFSLVPLALAGLWLRRRRGGGTARRAPGPNRA